MSIETELMAIKGNKELLVVEDVEAWAKAHPKSKLHRELEWDDRRAGYQFRLWQVRRLIGLHIRTEDGQRTVVSLSLDRTRDGGGYRHVDDVLRDKGLYEIMLADALNELKRVELKYEQVKQLKPVWREAARVRRQRQAKQKGGERRESA